MDDLKCPVCGGDLSGTPTPCPRCGDPHMAGQRLKDTIECAWRELGEKGQQLVPNLVRTIVTERACSPVETAAMVLGLQGEDDLKELIALTRNDDWMVRWSAQWPSSLQDRVLAWPSRRSFASFASARHAALRLSGQGT